ncbi:hypothetical protein EGW08_003777 [Elysia chlorotica]|uniref:G-protein coupled receptors family 1 profile domain-containing protein n=1 Tax=Elysia chlorotica TaxID=188477 RepID=A0A433U3S6_ELYCH|nr:hypothetical protein EGW08_003777 [Elysia chlorotica]
MHVYQIEGWTTEGTSPQADDDTSMRLAPLLSYAQLLNILFYVFNLTIPISFFGILTNITNILVFYKMGFSSPSNLSLFCLAISDLLCLCYILIVSFGNHPLFAYVDVAFSLPDVTRTGANVYWASAAIGAWITAVITVERSCCVAFPMKVNRIFSQKSIAALIGSMVIYQIASGLPRSFGIVLQWGVSPKTNKTLITFVTSNPRLIITSYLASYSIPVLTSFFVVVLGTVFLITKLKQNSQLRVSLKGLQNNQANKLSDKELRLVRTMVFICIIFIVGSTPGILMSVATNVHPPLNTDDPYLGFLCMACFDISVIFISVHSSVNIFVYLRMGSNYRRTFSEIFLSKSSKE